MRAVAIRKFGDPPERMDLPKPVPGQGEILVHVGSAGVNPFDWKIADGVLKDRMPHEWPLILGVDGSGTVEAVGEGVTRFKVDDGVYGSFLHAPVGRGTYAEYVVAPETNAIAKRPRGMYNDPAAAIPTPGMTALQALEELGVTKRQTLLIFGAAGGIGSFAVQLAANQGVQVVGAARGAQNRDYVLKFGAMRFYDTTSTMVHDEVRAAYPDGVDALLDVTSRGEALDKNVALVRKGGVVVSTIGALDPARAEAAGVRGVNLSMTPKVERLEYLNSVYSKGLLRIPLELKSPLDSAAELLRASREGTLRGKAVLVI